MHGIVEDSPSRFTAADIASMLKVLDLVDALCLICLLETDDSLVASLGYILEDVFDCLDGSAQFNVDMAVQLAQ